MKKHFLPALLIIFGTVGAMAQETQFSLGFMANPNVGWISAEDLDFDDNIDVESSGARMGFTYGVVGEYHFTNNYHLVIGAGHAFTGGSFSGVNNSADQPLPTADDLTVYNGVNYDPVKLQYIHVPILLRLKTNEIGYIRYFGNIGFAFNFGLNGKTSVKLSGTEYMEDGDGEPQIVPFADREPSSDLNFNASLLNPYLVVGIGGQYSLGGNSRVHVGIDYNNGLSNIISNKEVEAYDDIFENSRFQNSYISINLGIFL